MAKVIVLDDNVTMCAVLNDIVSYLGYEVSTFNQVELFLESVQREKPECLIVDANLRDQRNGLDVIEAARLLPGMEDSHYILLTASRELTSLKPRLKQRQIEVLTKPCSLEELEMALV